MTHPVLPHPFFDAISALYRDVVLAQLSEDDRAVAECAIALMTAEQRARWTAAMARMSIAGAARKIRSIIARQRLAVALAAAHAPKGEAS